MNLSDEEDNQQQNPKDLSKLIPGLPEGMTVAKLNQVIKFMENYNNPPKKKSSEEPKIGNP